MPTNHEALCFRGHHQHSLLEFTWATRDVTTECGGQGYQGQLNQGCNSAGAFTCTTAATIWVLVGTGSRVGLWKRQDRGTNPGYYLIAERKNGIEFYNEATTAPVGLLEAQVASIATGVWSTISVFCLCPIKVCGEWYEKRSAFMHLVSTDIGGKVLGQAERRAWWRLLCNMSHREKTRHFSAHAGSATTTARKLGHAHCVAHMHQRSKVIKSPPTRGAGLSKPLPAGMQAGRLVVPTQRSQGKRRR